jgi:hypothetical protein
VTFTQKMAVIQCTPVSTLQSVKYKEQNGGGQLDVRVTLRYFWGGSAAETFCTVIKLLSLRQGIVVCGMKIWQFNTLTALVSQAKFTFGFYRIFTDKQLRESKHSCTEYIWSQSDARCHGTPWYFSCLQESTQTSY